MNVLVVGLGDNLSEIRALIESAGYRLVGEVVQRRARPDPKTFVGKGKLEELKKAVQETKAEIVVLAGTLRPSQHYELEKALGIECFDRIRVILEIFTQRASSREAKLQVELAMLRYEIPILREWIHAGSLGERPGFMAGGEYRVDAYYETVKRKMTKVRRALGAVGQERAVRRDRRQERGFYQVSIAGYANAGKSSLFNALSGEQVLVEDRLFTTLATTTRALQGVKKRILLTDTVGFVSDVPLWLVEAFHSTFEEVYASDLVLLLVDASDPLDEVQAKVRLAATTLTPGTSLDSVQPLLTKTDLTDAAKFELCMEMLRQSDFLRAPMPVSMKTGDGLDALRAAILEEFRYPLELEIHVPLGDGSAPFLDWLYRTADVLSTDYRSDRIVIHLRCRDRDLSRIQKSSTIVSGLVPL
ncbi:MAG: GTPase HflX [Euryarchaeota archaeon]|nr:GTPase HflX [Euryarchaeota archaeon]